MSGVAISKSKLILPLVILLFAINLKNYITYYIFITNMFLLLLGSFFWLKGVVNKYKYLIYNYEIKLINKSK